MKYSPTEKGDIIAQLGACLAVQRTYGKQAADIQVVAKIFIDDLKDYSANEVVNAISKWRKSSPEFPTPADIIKLLDPAPKFDKSVYISLNKRRGDFTQYSWEYDYLKAYEANEIKKFSDTQPPKMTWQERNEMNRKRAGLTDEPLRAPATVLSPEEVKQLIEEFNAPKKDKPTFDVTEKYDTDCSPA